MTITKRAEAAIVGAVTVVMTAVVGWPLWFGRTFSVVPYGQIYTYPWGSLPPLASTPSAQSDQMESSSPWATFTHDVWTGANWPLWDPHGYAGGAPFAVNGMGGLYPIRVLIDTLFTGPVAHDAFVMVHVVAALVGCYLLCRQLHASVAASLVAALAWATSANVWAVIQLEMVTPFIAWLPLTLVCLDRAVRDRSRSALIASVASIAVALSSGNIVYVAMVMLTAGSYAMVLVVAPAFVRRTQRVSTAGRRALAAVAAFLGGALLAAFVFLPTALNLSATHRPPNTWAQIRAQTVPFGTLIHRLVFLPHGGTDATTVFSQAYLPTVVLILAAVGLIGTWGRSATVGRWLTVVPTLVFTGGPVTYAAYHTVPGLTSVVPARLIPVTVLGVCISAAAGADRLGQWISVGYRSLTTRNKTRRLQTCGGSRTVETLVVPSVAVAVLLGLVAWPGVLAARNVNAVPILKSAHPSFPATPAIQSARAQRSNSGWPLRFIQTQLVRSDPKLPPSLTSLIGDTPLAFGLDTWGGYDSSVPERTARLLAQASGNGPVLFPQTHPIYPTAQIDWPLVSRLGADMVFAPPSPGPTIGTNWGSLDTKRLELLYSGPDARVFRLTGSSAQPYLSGHIAKVQNDNAAIAALQTQGRIGSKTPVVETSDLKDADVSGLSGSGEVTSARKGTDSATLTTRTSGRQLLVIPISDTPGWAVQVRGRATSFVRVDYNYIGVIVPAGVSTVRLSYSPPGWRTGWALTIFCVLVLAATGAWTMIRRGTHRAPGPGRLAHRQELASRHSGRGRVRIQNYLTPEVTSASVTPVIRRESAL